MKKLFIVLISIAAIVATPILGQSIPRSYELQCAFDDGSRIAFKQHYTWDIFAAIIPADVTSKKYTGYDVRFISSKGKQSDWLKIRDSYNERFVDAYSFENIESARRFCGDRLMSLDQEYCYNGQCTNKKGQWKEAEEQSSDLSFPRTFIIPGPIVERPSTVRKELEIRQLTPDTVRVNTVQESFSTNSH